jgi:hypothetical protein
MGSKSRSVPRSITRLFLGLLALSILGNAALAIALIRQQANMFTLATHYGLSLDSHVYCATLVVLDTSFDYPYITPVDCLTRYAHYAATLSTEEFASLHEFDLTLLAREHKGRIRAMTMVPTLTAQREGQMETVAVLGVAWTATAEAPRSTEFEQTQSAIRDATSTVFFRESSTMVANFAATETAIALTPQ